jgi:hypothetical protein
MVSKKNSRMVRESKTVKVMISMYCKDHHSNRKLCYECAELKDYSLERLAKCPFQEGKTTCTRCPVHCFKPDMREKVRIVMRYAGLRMTYRHPVMALFHLIDGSRKEPIKPHDNTR